MIKCRLNILMAERDIRSVAELARQLEEKNLYISRQALQRIYHHDNLEKTRLETIIKLAVFFNCELKDLFVWDTK